MIEEAIAGSAVLPWMQGHLSSLKLRFSGSQSPHALLLTGAPGLGKALLAQQLAHYLLCQHSDSKPCGQCKACHLLKAASHPDLYQLEPEDGSAKIKVEQVRRLNAKVQETSQLGGYKIVILQPAEALNINAANALLKVLEEPPGDTLFILISSEPGRVLATIRSRCQSLAVSVDDPGLCLEWLKSQLNDSPETAKLLLALADGAPLRALELAQQQGLERRRQVFDALLAIQGGRQHPCEAAAAGANEIEDYLAWLQTWVEDLVRFSLAKEGGLLKNADFVDVIKQTCQQMSLDGLYLYLDQLQDARRLLLSGHNPNKILLLEQLLIGWKKLNLR